MKTAAEYRAMAQECFKWARETKTNEVRVSLLQLAQVWLDAASKLDGLPPTRTGLAPDTPDLAAFIEPQTSIFLATASAVLFGSGDEAVTLRARRVSDADGWIDRYQAGLERPPEYAAQGI